MVPIAAGVILGPWSEPISVEALTVHSRAKRQKELVPEDEDMGKLLNQQNLKLSLLLDLQLCEPITLLHCPSQIKVHLLLLAAERNPNWDLDLVIKEKYQFM